MYYSGALTLLRRKIRILQLTFASHRRPVLQEAATNVSRQCRRTGAARRFMIFLLFVKFDLLKSTVYCPKGKGGWVSMKYLTALRPSGTSYFFLSALWGGIGKSSLI